VYHVIRQSKPSHLDLEDLSLLLACLSPLAAGENHPWLREGFANGTFGESNVQLFAVPHLDTIRR
jgi:hypothetical protein